jgi:uncharacterized protein DUF429
MVTLGFDLGGKGRFGWCVAEMTDGRLRLAYADVADHARDAVEAARDHAGKLGRVVAAGIDSPLLWRSDGRRKADTSVRKAIKAMHANNIGGTVQSVNSLRGACLSQGILAAHVLRLAFPGIRLTESHPKALLWLCPEARRERQIDAVSIGDLNSLIECEAPYLTKENDHKRDAALGAVAACAMIQKAKRLARPVPRRGHRKGLLPCRMSNTGCRSNEEDRLAAVGQFTAPHQPGTNNVSADAEQSGGLQLVAVAEFIRRLHHHRFNLVV